MIVCESGGHANGLTCFIFRFLRRPQVALNNVVRKSHIVGAEACPKITLIEAGQPKLVEIVQMANGE